MKNRAATQRRITRRDLWVSLWLARLAGWLRYFGGSRDSALHRFLDLKIRTMAQAAMVAIFCQAVMRAGVLKQHTFKDPRIRLKHDLRAAFGSALRLAFRPVFHAKCFKARLAQLQHVWARRDQLAARLVRRLRLGLTRQAFKYTRAPLVRGMGSEFAATIAAMHAPASWAPRADTS